jgi:hypothetical protein
MNPPVLDYASPPPAEPDVPADPLPLALFVLGAAVAVATIAIVSAGPSPGVASVLVWVDALLGLVVPVSVLGAEPRPGRGAATVLFMLTVWGTTLAAVASL